MVNVMVERATSDMLIGPDWAMNIEICDICNHDPAQAKDVVRGIKKRLGSRNPKVQLLALTLLETVVKNCGDMVHMHVAEKDLPHEMVKIVKKKPDFHVKEKILILLDTWQEAFGGPRGRYPQYYVAYQDLLRLGAVFPQRSESLAPVFTPPQTHPLSSYPPNLRNPEQPRAIGAESAAEAEFPTLSMTELQNARGIMDVLSEMLSALDPENKEGLKQEVIVDLVEQCRSYKQRVVHLVNSTSDESLLCQGLALNDDLQRVLAKHEALASGAAPVQSDKSNTEPTKALVPVEAPLIDTGDAKQADRGSTSGTSLGAQLSIPPPTTNGQYSTQMKADPKFDLLSGDDLNALALVPVGQPQPTSPVASQHNALALVDMFSDSNDNQPLNSTGQAYPSSSQFSHDSRTPQPSPYPNGSVPGPLPPQHEQPLYSQGSSSTWNSQITQQQQPPSPVYGGQGSDAFPPPPWEAQLDNNLPAVTQPQQMQVTQGVASSSGMYLAGQQTVANDQALGAYNSGHFTGIDNRAMQNNQMHPYPIQNPQQPMVMYPQQMQQQMGGYMYPQQQQMYNHQMQAGYGYGGGYGYGQNQMQNQMQNAYFAQQTISALSVRDDSGLRNSASSNLLPSGRQARPEDKLFGDLVDISKFKPGKTTPGRAESM